MKRFLINLLIILFFGTSPLFAMTQQPAGAITQPAGTPQGGLDDESLQWFNEFFSQFSDEELEYFAKEGEKYIEEEMKKGKDLDTIFNEVLAPFEEIPAGKPGEIPAGVPLPAPTAPSIPVAAPSDLKKIDEAKVLLKTIADKIETIRGRAEHDRKSRELLKPWKFHINDLIYYTHALSQEKLVKYLPEKEFDQLFDTLRQLAQELSFYEPLYQIAQTGIEVENPYEVFGLSPAATIEDVQQAYKRLMAERSPDVIKKKMAEEGKSESVIKQAIANVAAEREAFTESYSTILAQEQSRQALHAILDALARAIYTNDIFGKIKKLIQKYEPEALKIKESQEKLEKEARDAQEKLLKARSPWTPPVREPLVDFGYGTTPTPISTAGGYPSAYPTGGIGGETAGLPGIPGKPSEAGKAGKPGEAAKKEEKEKKAGEEKKEAGKKEEGKKKKGPEISKKVLDKVKKVDTMLESSGKYFEQKLDEREKLEGPEAAPKDVFKNFIPTLQESAAAPYSATDPILKKAKDIKFFLEKISGKLHEFKREIRDLKDFDKLEKAQFRAMATERFEKFKKDYLNKYMGDIFSVIVTPDKKILARTGEIYVPAEKKYIFFGINEFADLKAAENKPVTELNKFEEETTPEGATTYKIPEIIPQMKEAIQAIERELKPRKT